MQVEDEVKDEFEEEIPPTQLPENFSKRRATRASTSRNPAPKSSTSGQAAPAGHKPASTGANRRRGAHTLINMTQKRKDNISSSFLASLRNKGISEELRKTKR